MNRMCDMNGRQCGRKWRLLGQGGQMAIDLWLDDAKIEVFRVAGMEEFVPWRGRFGGKDGWNFFLSFEKRGNDGESTPWKWHGVSQL